jgi:hypothetical protein
MEKGEKLSLEEHLELNKEKLESKWTSKSINDITRYLDVIGHYENSLELEKSNKLGPFY